MDEYKNENSQIVEAIITPVEKPTQIEVNVKNTKKKKNKKGKFLSYIVVGLICALIGSISSSAAFMYVLPKSNFFKNTPLYQSMNNNETTKVSTPPVPIAANTSGLSVTEIAKKVGPAVVGVSTKTAAQRDILGFIEKGQEGMGSGIIFNKDGYILTNYHVINGAQKISVILNNGKEVPAKVVNYDAALDLAVIKLTDKTKMPAVAEFGKSKDLQVGESVVAIGNPLGKELLGSVTTGVISAVNREISIQGEKHTYIQTDAAINPGNSGGALVNSLGQVIGINSAKMGGNGVEGLGFAIPIDDVKPKIQNLLKPILVIGISASSVTDEISKERNLPVGVYIHEVQQYSAAEKAGLKPGDVIIKFDGKTVKTVAKINDIKAKHNSGDIIKVNIIRNGDKKTINLKLSE